MILKNFIKLNQKISKLIENIIPHSRPDITELYSQIISDYVSKNKKPIIVDIGGGRLTPSVKYFKAHQDYKLIVIDSNKSELLKNRDADKKIIANLDKKLPLKQNSVDFIVSRYVFEHLNNLPLFLLNSNKALKKDGRMIHLFSCKFAAFALLNQILPDKISKLLLELLIPESKNIHGYKTNYNYCFYSAISKLFTKNNYKIEKIYLSYYQSRYFSFFVPFYLFSVVYELILYIFGLKNLCAYIIIIAKKNGD